MITVRFPAALQAKAGRELVIEEPVADVPALLAALDRKVPGLCTELTDPIYNFAVNDDLLLHNVNARTLKDGDVVEIVPALSGG